MGKVTAATEVAGRYRAKFGRFGRYGNGESSTSTSAVDFEPLANLALWSNGEAEERMGCGMHGWASSCSLYRRGRSDEQGRPKGGVSTSKVQKLDY